MIDSKKYTWIINFLLVWTLLTTSESINAQVISTKNKAKVAYKHIETLKEATLVVRLRSKNRKLMALEKAAQKDGLTPKQKKNWEKKIQHTIMERDSFNLSLMRKLNAYYNFSKIAFMYDTATTEFKSGVYKGYLLDKQLDVDPSIAIEGPVYMLRIGYLNASDYSGRESLIIADQNVEDLEHPFPFSIGVTGVGNFLNALFSPRSFEMVSSKTVKKFNKRLHRFYKLARKKRLKEELSDS